MQQNNNSNPNQTMVNQLYGSVFGNVEQHINTNTQHPTPITHQPRAITCHPRGKPRVSGKGAARFQDRPYPCDKHALYAWFLHGQEWCEDNEERSFHGNRQGSQHRPQYIRLRPFALPFRQHGIREAPQHLRPHEGEDGGGV